METDEQAAADDMSTEAARGLPPRVARLRDFERLTGKCGICEYRSVRGGCRARAFSATGDFLAPEPMCPHAPRRSHAQ